jgi:orotidine-5'-phosphate decarboxylase
MALKNNFADRLLNSIDEKKNPTIVGLDPNLEKIPPHIVEKYLSEGSRNELEAASDAILEFNKGIIDSVYDIVPGIKPQIAYYEVLGEYGIKAFRETVEYAKKKSLLVIGDAKRNDIGSTCQAYSDAFLGKVKIGNKEREIFGVDCLTVNGYLGYDGIEPFIKNCSLYGRGIFILVKTSNKGSEEFQCIDTVKGKNYELMGDLVSSWGKDLVGDEGYSSVGAVVGATFPEEAKILREKMKDSIFLVPGYGAQGGTAEAALNCFNPDGRGAVINSSRGIIYAWVKKGDGKDYKKNARDAALEMKEDISSAMKRGNKYRW